LTPTYILAPGELPRQFAFSCGPFPQAHKLQSVTWWKPITRFLSIHLSGQDWLSGWVMTTSPLTQASVLVVQHPLHLQNAHSSLAMCPAPTIQQTAHPGAFTLQKICCFPRHASPKPYNPSSQTLTVPKSLLDVMGPMRPPKHTLSMISTPAHETHATTSTTSFIIKERKSSKRQKRESLHTQLQIHIKNKQNTKLLQLTLIT
jgi:hypothetical protein